MFEYLRLYKKWVFIIIGEEGKLLRLFYIWIISLIIVSVFGLD